MKKIIALWIIILAVTGCGCSTKSYDEINYKEYSNLIEEKKDFILYIGSATCSHCQDFVPTLKKVIRKYNIDIKYIDISKLSQQQYAVLQNKTKVQGTPTIVFVHKGIVDSGSDNKIQGAVSESEVEKVLKKKGYIE